MTFCPAKTPSIPLPMIFLTSLTVTFSAVPAAITNMMATK
ncbi:Uncharacterised protein [Vibrio cholerae]|nr:Uncharacterised protein [Vibrio cholerae]